LTSAPGYTVFTQQFELLWPPDANASDGSKTFNTLLSGFADYYIEACSDPLGQKTYKATFSSVNTDVSDLSDPAYFLGEKFPDPIKITMTLHPLPSRALIRLLDNASKISIPGSKGGQVTIKIHILLTLILPLLTMMAMWSSLPIRSPYQNVLKLQEFSSFFFCKS